VGKLADLYDRMQVTARSPDRTVTISVTGRGALSLELAPDIMQTHSEESLERQLNAVVRVAVAAYQQAQRQAYERAVGEASG
jgi:DNA-binding protein YbaB